MLESIRTLKGGSVRVENIAEVNLEYPVIGKARAFIVTKQKKELEISMRAAGIIEMYSRMYGGGQPFVGRKSP